MTAWVHRFFWRTEYRQKLGSQQVDCFQVYSSTVVSLAPGAFRFTTAPGARRVLYCTAVYCTAVPSHAPRSASEPRLSLALSGRQALGRHARGHGLPGYLARKWRVFWPESAMPTPLVISALLHLVSAGPVSQGDCAAHAAAVVVHGDARFTVLSERVVRMEKAPFVDDCTFTVVRRNVSVPAFTQKVTGNGLTIATTQLTLTHVRCGSSCSPQCRATTTRQALRQLPQRPSSGRRWRVLRRMRCRHKL